MIVQPHLLKDKSSVRLRRILFEAATTNEVSNASGNEQFVELDNLASTIRELSIDSGGGLDEDEEENADSRILSQSGGREISNTKSGRVPVNCIYVDHDQYFDDREISRIDSTKWKSIKKSMKSISQKSESYILSMSDASLINSMPVFAADLSFWVMRDFGTCLMKRSSKDQSASGACLEITERYPKNKRVLKTLGTAIDNYMRRSGAWSAGNSTSSSRQLTMLLLYSKVDDRFDLVSLEKPRGSAANETHGRNSRRR